MQGSRDVTGTRTVDGRKVGRLEMKETNNNLKEREKGNDGKDEEWDERGGEST